MDTRTTTISAYKQWHTHNFVQEEVANRLGYEMQELPAFKVFIGSGEYLLCKEVCRQVSISIQNTCIIEDLFILAMRGANVVLRIQWLGKLGPVTTDHKELSMEFWDGERKVRLQGDSHLADSEISKTRLKKLIAKGEIAYFCQLRFEETEAKEQRPWPELKEVLEEFKDVLAEPLKLPLDRETNHHITLLPGSQPVNMHPYRYPYYQKIETERPTQEMLNQGLIHNNISSFS